MKKCIFLVAGRLVDIKGHEFLFDALERIPEALEYECRILGTGPNMDRYKQRLESSSIKNHVVLKGHVPYEQMGEEYRQADVLIFPSLRESSGAVLIEAMAKGLPIITINKFGGATILDNETGWLYDGDTKEAYLENLKNAIVECIQHPEEVKRKGEKAKKQAEKLTWEEKVEEYQAIYNRLAE